MRLEISKIRHGLGFEHPLCDRIQLIMIVLFFVVWVMDFLSFFFFGYSTIVFQALDFPLILAGTIIFLLMSSYLISKSHNAVLEKILDSSVLVDSGVYSWVRHPMYLGTLIFCLAFIFIGVSILSIGIWIVFFIFYDRMASYEEISLIEILGEEYIVYQKRVSKWLPGVY